MKANFPNPYSTYGIKPPPSTGEERPRFELASPYGPEATEDMPDRQHSVKLLRALRTGWEELRDSNQDYFVGMTVHGSSVKGRMHDQSDLDVVVFTDPEAEVNFDHNELFGRSPLTKAAILLNKGVEDSGHMLTEGRIVLIDFYPINTEIIEDDASRLVAESGRKSNVVGIAPSPLAISRRTYDLFGLRIGSGKVQEFREVLLRELTRLEGGDYAWEVLAKTIVQREEYRRGANIYFPDTLEKALCYYGFENSGFQFDPNTDNASATTTLSGTQTAVAKTALSSPEDQQNTVGDV